MDGAAHLYAALLAGAHPAGAQMPKGSTHPLADLSRAFRHAYERAKPAVVFNLGDDPIAAKAHIAPLPPGNSRGLSRHRLRHYRQRRWLHSEQLPRRRRGRLHPSHPLGPRTYRAKVIGFDSLIDHRPAQVEAQGLPTVQLADSDRLQIGDWVLAIGHPLGMGSTLTHGIVSALGRQAGIFNPRSDEENRYAMREFHPDQCRD